MISGTSLYLLCIFATYTTVFTDTVEHIFNLIPSHGGFASNTLYFDDASKVFCAARSSERNDSLSFQYNLTSKQCGVHIGRFRSAVMPIEDPYLVIYWTFFKSCSEHLGYVFYQSDNVCVKLHSDPKSWWDANSVCDSEKGHMYLVNSLAKFELLKTVLQAEGIGSANYFYLGGNDLYVEGQFLWLDGSTYIKFQGQPDNQYNEEHCIGYRTYGSGVRDVPCYLERRFLCEIPLLPK